MTPFSKVYDSFLSKITDDMYMELTKEETYGMLEELLKSAIPLFEFPRQSLDTAKFETSDNSEQGYFISDLTSEEIDILGTYMVVFWLGRQLASIELTRMKYTGADFKMTSQANHLPKLTALKKEYERMGFHEQRLYKRRKKDSNGVYRSTMHILREKPVYPFSRGNENPATSTEKEDYWYGQNEN